jgi:signal transduction histidine kinase
MVTRTLEARLSTRLLVLASAVLISFGIAGAVVVDRALSAGDETRARGEAIGARQSLAVELSEGDSPSDAAREVLASSEGEGARLVVWFADGSHYSTGSPELPRLAEGACATIEDAAANPWLACATGDATASVVAAVSIAGHREAVATVKRAIVVMIVVATLLLWLAIRRALRAPLAELTSLVRWSSRLREPGSDDVPRPAAQTREIELLSEAFDALVRDLLEALARERASSAHIAHELRTPLTAIVAELDALASRDPGTRDAAVRIRADVARLSNVIDAILVLSDRIRVPPREVVNVADLAREFAAGVLIVEAPDEALVEADERLVRLALGNLVENAHKYGGGARVLRVSRAEAGAKLAVIDEGAGLNAAERDRMFERYWRQSPEGTGRGLGLALVRAVAERHGGGVAAVPGPGGRGLEVSLTLGRVVGWHEPGVVPLGAG